MARLSNIPFVGSSVFDCDVDAATFRRVVRDAQADTAGVYDMVTGANTPSVTLDRDGTEGHGSLIGAPLVNQWLSRDFGMVNPAATGADGGPGRAYLLAVPVFVPPGETEIVVHITGDLGIVNLSPWSVIKSASTFANNSDAAPLTADPAGIRGRDFKCTLTNVVSGAQILVVEIAYTPLNQQNNAIDSWSVYFPRTEVDRATSPATRETTESNALPITTPSATEALAFVDMDSTRFPTGSNVAIDGVMLTSLNRSQNGLIEYITGWPVGSQKDYTQVDHDGVGVADDVAPARSRFWSLNNSLAGAPVPQFALPIASWAGGPVYLADGVNATPGVLVDPSAPTTVGMTEWFPPWIETRTKTGVGQCMVNVPDLPTSAALKWVVLCTAMDVSELSSWIVHVSTDAFATEDTAVPAVLSGNVIIATGTALGVTKDTLRALSVAFSKPTGTKNPATNPAHLCFVGACFYYEP